MKTTIKYIFAGLVLSSTVGCKERMIELNSNPETVSSTKMEYLFTGATDKFDGRSRDAFSTKFTGVGQLMQYVSKYGDGNSYVDPTLPGGTSVPSYGHYYDQYFGEEGNKLQTILDQIDAMEPSVKERHADIAAICKVLVAFQQWRLVEQYGASIYKEAFKALSQGITRPKYDLGQDIYADIDALYKEAIVVLSAPEVTNSYELKGNDYFFGYTLNPDGTVSRIDSYDQERSNWLRFANIARLEMAWKLKKVDAAFFEKVKGEVLAVPNGIMTRLEDGAYYHYASDYDDNPDDVGIMSQQYAISNTMVTALKALKDPRLQYLARPNGVSSVNSFNYRVMKALYPDSLAKYGEILQDGNIFQGQIANPRFQGKAPVELANISEANPNFVGVLSKSFILPNINYPNDLKFTDPKTQEESVICMGTEKEFTMAIQIASPAQARYFVKCGGKGEQNQNPSISDKVNEIRRDGPTDNMGTIRLRRPLLTYPQQCFMFAHLGITVNGKSPIDWYKEGVKNAMVELRNDAKRFQIQIAVSPTYPKFPGYNPDGNFAYTDADIDTYVAARLAAPGFNVEEDAINQAWIYFFESPENAYSWWKVTGLPAFKEHATPAQAAAVTNVYLEKPYKDTKDLEPLAYPRRGILPDRMTVNKENYNYIKETLQKQPGFGEWSFTTGRIWWDKE